MPSSDRWESELDQQIEAISRSHGLTYASGSSITTKKKLRLTLKTKKDYIIERQLKEKKKIHTEFYKLLDEILETVEISKVKEAQKKHLRLKFKQHLLWFKEYGLKE